MKSEDRKLERDEVSARDLLAIVCARWRFIVVFTLVVVAAVATASLILPKQYEASVLLSSAGTAPRAGALSSLAGQFGGLAALAGINVGSDEQSAESVAVLKSEVLLRQYITDNDLLPVLYESRWDSSRKAWKSGPKTAPTLWEAVRKFKEIRDVSTESRTGLVTLKIKWKDPAVAAKWANDLVKRVNDYQRSRAIAESERSIAYLNSEALRTNVVEARQAIYSVLEEELNKAMMARGREEYAFRVVDPATAPERPVSPRPVLWTLVALCLGLLISTFFVILRAALK